MAPTRFSDMREVPAPAFEDEAAWDAIPEGCWFRIPGEWAMMDKEWLRHKTYRPPGRVFMRKVVFGRPVLIRLGDIPDITIRGNKHMRHPLFVPRHALQKLYDEDQK